MGVRFLLLLVGDLDCGIELRLYLPNAEFLDEIPYLLE
jgi:hypothetical protein